MNPRRNELVISEVVAFVSFLLGEALLTSPAPHAALSTPGALTAVVGTGLYLCVIGLFALALAALIRHAAGAISAFVFLLLVLPLIVEALPRSMQNAVNQLFDPFAKRLFWQAHADVVCQLLVASVNKGELVTVLTDRISVPSNVAYDDLMKGRVNRRFGATAVVGCLCLDSRTNDLMQLADLVAGSVAYDRGLQGRPTSPERPRRRRSP